MNNFDKLKSKTLDEFAEWLDVYGAFDGSPWIEWFDKNYCNGCEPEIAYVPEFNKNQKFSWCELHDKCRYIPKLDEVPDNKQIIKMWLESECGLDEEDY